MSYYLTTDKNKTVILKVSKFSTKTPGLKILTVLVKSSLKNKVYLSLINYQELLSGQ